MAACMLWVLYGSGIMQDACIDRGAITESCCEFANLLACACNSRGALSSVPANAIGHQPAEHASGMQI